jgi:FkbM family methyltransferase
MSTSGLRRRLSSVYHVALRHRTIDRWRRGVVNLIDVGSSGAMPLPWREQAYRIKHLLNFEPMEGSSTTGTVTTIGAALWRLAEERPLYVYRGKGSASLFRQDEDFVRANYDELRRRGPRHLADTWFDRSQLVETRKIHTTTLDAVLASLGNGVTYHFLKLDTQGADLAILEGGEGFVGTDCIGIQLEAFTIPLLRGIPLLADIDAFLARRGFDRAWTAPAHGTFDSQHDVLYLRHRAPSSPALDAIRAVYGLS